MDKVVVLLSTYNGEKYIQEQIESLKKQEGVKCRIVVRDDGSTDATKERLEEYSRLGVLEWYEGENLGPARSFLELMKRAPMAEYYALCDQDDYWMSDKVLRGITQIKKYSQQKPILYYGRPRIVDEKLELLEKLEDRKPSVSVDSFSKRLITRNATGCTFVMNRALVEAVNKYTPDFIEMHDAWIYQVCSALRGVFVYDEDVHILYRQHGNNVAGVTMGFTNRLRKRLERFYSGSSYRRETAKEVLRVFESVLSEEEKKDVCLLIDYKKNFFCKLRLLLSKRYRMNSFKRNLNFKLAVLLGIF